MSILLKSFHGCGRSNGTDFFFYNCSYYFFILHWQAKKKQSIYSTGAGSPNWVGSSEQITGPEAELPQGSALLSVTLDRSPESRHLSASVLTIKHFALEFREVSERRGWEAVSLLRVQFHFHFSIFTFAECFLF